MIECRFSPLLLKTHTTLTVIAGDDERGATRWNARDADKIAEFGIDRRTNSTLIQHSSSSSTTTTIIILFINHNTINIHHTTPMTYNKQSDNLPERASDRYQGIYGKRVFKTHLFSNHSDSFAFGVPLTRLAVD